MARDLDALARDLGELARNLRQAGDEDLRREVLNAIHHAADPVPETIRSELPSRLPDPYAAVLDRDLNISVSVRTGAASPGVTVRARTRSASRRRLRRVDQGILYHPLYGNRRHWYAQQVRPGWFTRPNEDAAPRVRREIEDALERVKDEIFKGVHG